MTDIIEPLVLDLLEWIGTTPRPYVEVMDAWRTSCPRLTVWEDALDRGFVRRLNANTALVETTDAGRAFVKRHNRTARLVDRLSSGSSESSVSQR